MKKIAYLLMLILPLFVLNNCTEDLPGTEDLNYVSFESTTFDFGVDLNSSAEREIKIYSTQISSSDRSFAVSVDTDLSSADPASYTVPSTITIPAHSNVGILSVNVTDVNISENGETLVIKFASVDGLYAGENITLNIRTICPFNEVMLKITFDDWPEETSWELLDSDDVVINSGGPYPGESSYSKAFCLVNGTYTFIIYDVYGDGTGDYSLIYDGTLLADGGGFGAQESTTFTVNK